MCGICPITICSEQVAIISQAHTSPLKPALVEAAIMPCLSAKAYGLKKFLKLLPKPSAVPALCLLARLSYYRRYLRYESFPGYLLRHTDKDKVIPFLSANTLILACVR